MVVDLIFGSRDWLILTFFTTGFSDTIELTVTEWYCSKFIVGDKWSWNGVSGVPYLLSSWLDMHKVYDCGLKSWVTIATGICCYARGVPSTGLYPGKLVVVRPPKYVFYVSIIFGVGVKSIHAGRKSDDFGVSIGMFYVPTGYRTSFCYNSLTPMKAVVSVSDYLSIIKSLIISGWFDWAVSVCFLYYGLTWKSNLCGFITNSGSIFSIISSGLLCLTFYFTNKDIMFALSWIISSAMMSLNWSITSAPEAGKLFLLFNKLNSFLFCFNIFSLWLVLNIASEGLSLFVS